MTYVAEIRRRAQEALANCPVVELRRIEVVFEGVCLEDQSLLISGTVSSFYYKQLAEEVVRPFCDEIELFNVILVDNQRFVPAALREDPMSELLKSPESAPSLLAESIKEIVHKGTLGGVAGLGVEIRGGTILLRGHCASYYCKQLAQQLVKSIAAGAPLCNHIRVK